MHKRVLSAALAFVFCFLPVISANNNINDNSNEIRIAFIDTGVSSKYMDSSKIIAGKNYVFPYNDTFDRNGHGTETCSMVLGSAELGISGSCPEAVVVPLVTSDLHPLGFLKSGGAQAMTRAIYDAVDVYNCRVINISMGLTTETKELKEAVYYAEEKGVVIVSAVGNENKNAPERSYYPAAYDTVIGVGSSNGEEAADFSQRNGVLVVADGVNVKTVSNTSKAETRNGTSYSCAYVSGVCAGILKANPRLTPASVRALLCAKAQDIGDQGFDKATGFGKVSDGLNKNPLTRGALAMILYMASGEKSAGEIPFADVPESSSLKEAISYVYGKGILKGVSETEFNPQGFITREQLATVILRYMSLKEDTGANTKEEVCYKDFSLISPWARDAVNYCKKSQLMIGNENGDFMPKDYVLGYQVYLVLERIFKR